METINWIDALHAFRDANKEGLISINYSTGTITVKNKKFKLQSLDYSDIRRNENYQKNLISVYNELVSKNIISDYNKISIVVESEYNQTCSFRINKNEIEHFKQILINNNYQIK